jgi:hypothetical protein
MLTHAIAPFPFISAVRLNERLGVNGGNWSLSSLSPVSANRKVMKAGSVAYLKATDWKIFLD